MATRLTADTLILIGVAALLLTACATNTRVDPVLARQISDRIGERGIHLTPQLINRFEQVAFGSEYGNAEHNAPLISWGDEIRIRLVGETVPENEKIVHEAISDLNALLIETRLRLVETGEHIQMGFTDQAGFRLNTPDYAHDNTGYFHISWHPKTKRVERGKILIRKDVSIELRRHVVLEELTQILGLMRDIRSPGSIFSQSDSSVTDYTPLDRDTIRLWEALRPLAGHGRPAIMRMLRDQAAP